jgi:DNA-binding MarR family transcriptional regulator
MSQDDDLFFLLHDVARLGRLAADKLARVDGMTRAQWAMLLRLARNPGLSQKELADLLEVEPISVARLADRLEQNGLIERRADKSDRRIWRLHLTDAAAPALRRIAAQRDELATLISTGIPETIRATMMQGLKQMKANLLNQPETTVANPHQEIA